MLLKADTRFTSRNKFLQLTEQILSLRDKWITQGDKRETLTKNLQRNNVTRQNESFCILYFAAFIHEKKLYKLTRY